MFIPFVDLKRINGNYKKDFEYALNQTINFSEYILGKPVLNFEEEFATFSGLKSCIGVANGTDALYASIRYFDKPKDAEVIVPSNSWVSTSEIVSQAGYKVVFCDVDPDTFLITSELIKEVYTSNTVGVIPVHLYGQMANMPDIRSFCKEKNIWIIEDSAQAHGAYCEDGHSPGFETLSATYSFYPGKNLGALGDGGAVCSDNIDFANWVRLFSRHGGKNVHTIEGINSRLDSLQARFLSLKLPNLIFENNLRINAAKFYDELLSDIEEIKTPYVREKCNHVYHVYCIIAEERDELKSFLLNNGIQTGIHYKTPLPFLPAYKDLDHKENDFPLLKSFYKKILSLPIFPGIKKEEQKYVVEIIKNFYSKKSKF